MKAAQQPPPGCAHPPRCLLSIRFFCRTGCSGMLSVMAAAGGAERGGMRFPAAPRSARHGSAGLGSARRGAGLAARRCRARSARPGSPRLASGLPQARFGPLRARLVPAALRRPPPRPLGVPTPGTAVPAAEAPPAGRGVGAPRACAHLAPHSCRARGLSPTRGSARFWVLTWISSANPGRNCSDVSALFVTSIFFCKST